MKWIELGVYPGILVGSRTYRNKDRDVTVFYIPFVSLAIIKIRQDAVQSKM